MRPVFVLVFALTAAGCMGPTDPTVATGSSTLAASADGEFLYAVTAEEDLLTRVEVATGAVTEVELRGEPTRVARADGRVFVTLRGARTLVVLDEETLEVTERIATGAEPYGVVARRDGRRVYVASSLSNRVEAYNPATGAQTASWTVPGEPRWLALHPDGDVLFVAGAAPGMLHEVNIARGSVRRLDVLTASEAGSGTVRRITGDPSVSDDGARIAIPILDVTPDPPFVSNAYYGSGGTGGTPGPGTSVLVGELGEPGTLDVSRWQRPRLSGVFGYPTSAVFGAGGEQIILTLESSDAVLALTTPSRASAEDGGSPQPSMSPDDPSPVEVEAPVVSVGTPDAMGVAFVPVGKGPRGAWTDGAELLVHAGIEGELQSVDGEEAYVVGELVARSRISEQIRLGRELFYSETNVLMSASFASVSCSTCHFEGRTDGVTWTLPTGAWQTPSLAGRVTETHPVTWANDVGTVAEEARLTAGGRMGGQGLDIEQSEAIEAFIDWVREVDVPDKGADDAAVARGRVIFESRDAACSSCHSGSRFTDRQSHSMYGLDAVDTPSLTGVAATAPYLHDGRYATLTELLDSLTGQMGDTRHLDSAELGDLEAFLRSL